MATHRQSLAEATRLLRDAAAILREHHKDKIAAAVISIGDQIESERAAPEVLEHADPAVERRRNDDLRAGLAGRFASSHDDSDD